jgi:NAD(P)-dependent dehydrogenase (short-subunit alcohol dehydrogenase family)
MPSDHAIPSRALAAVAIVGGAIVAAMLASRRASAADETFAGRVVLITGGSRGLGLALARRFASEGARLALIARSASALDAAADLLRREWNAEVITAVCDVRDEAAVRAKVAAIAHELGGIDVLVNNAGVIQVMPFEHAHDEDFADSLDTHFWGPLRMVRACLPYLARSGGRIVNITSIGGRVAVPHLLPYVAGKFALVGLSEGLQAELVRQGISVTTVTPHLMRTGSHRNVVVRGRHASEATWFALGSASRLTALDADQAAELIVGAARDRQSHVTVGMPARVAELAQAVAPAAVAAIRAAVARFLLPGPARDGEGDRARMSRDIDVGAIAGLFATEAARRLNQPVAADEQRRRQPAL